MTAGGTVEIPVSARITYLLAVARPTGSAVCAVRLEASSELLPPSVAPAPPVPPVAPAPSCGPPSVEALEDPQPAATDSSRSTVPVLERLGLAFFFTVALLGWPNTVCIHRR